MSKELEKAWASVSRQALRLQDEHLDVEALAHLVDYLKWSTRLIEETKCFKHDRDVQEIREYALSSLSGALEALHSALWDRKEALQKIESTLQEEAKALYRLLEGHPNKQNSNTTEEVRS